MPLHPVGFEAVFLGEMRFYAIRISKEMREEVKFVAAYRVASISAITHIAIIDSIELWNEVGVVDAYPGYSPYRSSNRDRYVISFSEAPVAIRAVPAAKDGRVFPPQGPRYASRARIEAALSLDDVW
ncbi:MAG: hypothetical protein DLM70_02415 [Chloroflexi bacterium]|nr:MAG: hypothetical protein DLM70_02415 [Chloroflexota bacterium]